MSGTYGVIEERGLLRHGRVNAARVGGMPREELSRLYEEYSEVYRLAGEGQPGTSPHSSRFQVYPDSIDPSLPLRVVRQLCLYAHNVFIDDPLYRLAKKWRDTSPKLLVVMRGAEAELAYHRVALRVALSQLAEIRPLVDAGIVTLLGRPARIDVGWPVQLSAPVPEPADLPPALCQYGEENIVVQPMRLENREFIVDDRPLAPCRMIAVKFRSGTSEPFSFYTLHDILPQGEGEVGTTTFRTVLPFGGEDTVDPAHFEAWVNQSAARALAGRVNGIAADVISALSVGARLITASLVSRDMLELCLGAECPADLVPSALLNLDLPVLQKVPIRELAVVRRDEEAFARFRQALDQAFAEIASGPQDAILQRIETVKHDLLEDAVERIDQASQRLTERTFVGALVVVAGLAAAFPSGGWSLVALAAAALAKAYDSADQMQTLKADPAYFLWKLKSRARG